MKAALIIYKTIPDLVDFWKSNDVMLNRAQSSEPEIFLDVKSAFTKRKNEIQKGEV